MPATVAPTIGMNAPRKTSTPMASTKGTPRIAATTITPMASARATSTVARTNWVSEIHATRPEPSTCSRAARGARRTSQAQMRLAVGEEEVGREQDDEEARHHVPDHGADLGHPGDGAALAGLLGDGALRRLDPAVELAVAEVERTRQQPLADLVESLDHRGGEVLGAAWRPAGRRTSAAARPRRCPRSSPAPVASGRGRPIDWSRATAGPTSAAMSSATASGSVMTAR